MNDLPVDQSAENPANPAMTMVSGLDENGLRLSSMDFERLVRLAAAESSEVVLRTYGQHNIGIRLQRSEGLHLEISGPCGQRLGCMGMPGTSIICHNAVSDDVGYLNIGAEITILGDATNGVCNAMAAGKVFIGGSIGARGLTMTKWNPDYERPELWVLGSTGDSFAEFNCGGVCRRLRDRTEKPGQRPGLSPLRRHGWRHDLFSWAHRRLVFPQKLPPGPPR
jgi:hypothetical protein